MLIENEIIFAYRKSRLVNLKILNRVVCHIGRMAGRANEPDVFKSNAIVEQIPLTFVLNERDSAVEFTKQLTSLCSTYFNFIDAGDRTFYAVVDRNRYREWSRFDYSIPERPFDELPTSEFVTMKPDDATAPVLRLRTADPTPKSGERFVKRSQSFSGFSRLFYAEREQMLKGTV